MRVLVTGAAGKVGRRAVAAMAEAGHEVVASDRVAAAPDTGENAYVRAELTDAQAAAEAVHGCDAVVHAGAMPSPTGHPPHEVLHNNLIATFNVLEAAVAAGVRRFVHVSSVTVTGLYFGDRPVRPRYAPIDEDHPLRPHDPYALSKLFGEQLMDAAVHRSGIACTSIRPVWVLDASEPGLVGSDPGNSEDYCSYVAVHDLADLLRLAAESDLPGHDCFYAASPDNYAARPLAELVAERDGTTVEVRPVDRPDAGGVSSAKAVRALGWRPRRSWREYVRGG